MTSPHEEYAVAAGYELRNPAAPGLVVLLHGLGGDRSQPLGLLAEGLDGYAVLAPDARAHGATDLLGNPDDFRFPALAGDLLALLRRLGQHRKPTVLAGISMGCAIALRVLLTGTLDVRGVVLVRPAFTDQPSPTNLAALPVIADLLDSLGPEGGAPAGAASQLGQFSSRLAQQRSRRLREIASDRAYDGDELANVRVPTLVIGAPQDPEHPMAIAERWGVSIPGAHLLTVPSRDDDPIGYRKAIADATAAHVAQSLTSARPAEAGGVR